jgi:hypothetical protein
MLKEIGIRRNERKQPVSDSGRTSCIGVYPEGGMVIRLFEK